MANDYTYRADHVGGLLPPAALVEARARRARGEIGADGLQEAENAAVKSLVEMQRSVGIAVATIGSRSRLPYLGGRCNRFSRLHARWHDHDRRGRDCRRQLFCKQ